MRKKCSTILLFNKLLNDYKPCGRIQGVINACNNNSRKC